MNADYRIRIRVFVDFWNFQLTMNSLVHGFKIDWQRLGRVLAEEALRVVDATVPMAYQGINVYGSYDPSSEKDQRLGFSV